MNENGRGKGIHVPCLMPRQEQNLQCDKSDTWGEQYLKPSPQDLPGHK